MSATKHSRQREALLNELCSRFDHPTAETLYLKLKESMPNISLGTVYRNLGTLSSDGTVMKISVGGAERYDGNASAHPHFLCRKCGELTDIKLEAESILQSAAECTGGNIEGYSLTLYGVCDKCIE